MTLRRHCAYEEIAVWLLFQHPLLPFAFPTVLTIRWPYSRRKWIGIEL